MTEQTQDKPALDATTRSLVARLWRDWMRAHLAQLALAVVLMIVIAGSAAVFTLFIERAVDLLEQRDWRFLWISAAIVALAIFKGFAGYAQTVVSESVALRIINRMQKAMFAHLMRADIASFHETSTGTLMSRFTNDVAMMRDALSKSLVRLVRNSLTALALIGRFRAGRLHQRHGDHHRRRPRRPRQRHVTSRSAPSLGRARRRCPGRPASPGRPRPWRGSG